MMRSISVLLLFSATAIVYMFSKKETKSRRVAPKVARTESDILGVKAANHTNALITLFWHVRNVDDVVLDQLDHLLGSWAYRERHLKVKWSAAEDIGFANMPSKKIFKKLHKLNPSRFEPIQWNEDLFPKGGTPCLWSGAEQYGCNECLRFMLCTNTAPLRMKCTLGALLSLLLTCTPKRINIGAMT